MALLGFIEYLENPALIIRIGSQTTDRTNPYQRSVIGEILSSSEIVLKGYDQGIDRAHFTKAMVMLHGEGFRTAHMERLGPPHRTLTLTLGPKGVIGMKTHVQSVKGAYNPDGTINAQAAEAGADAAKAAYLSGKEKLLGLHEIVLHDGSVLTTFHHVAADGVGSTK